MSRSFMFWDHLVKGPGASGMVQLSYLRLSFSFYLCLKSFQKLLLVRHSAPSSEGSVSVMPSLFLPLIVSLVFGQNIYSNCRVTFPSLSLPDNTKMFLLLIKLLLCFRFFPPFSKIQVFFHHHIHHLLILCFFL